MNTDQHKLFKTTQQLAVVLLISAVSGLTQAAVTLLTPEEIPVLAVDQQEVSSGLFRSSKTTYKLDPGTHDIAVRYEQLFNHSNGEHDVLKSAVVSIRAELADNKTYRLALVNPPKNFDDAQDYVKQPTIAVLDEQGNAIAQQQALDNTPKPLLGSSMFNRVMDFRGSKKQQIAKATATYANAPVSAPVVSPVTAGISPVAATNVTTIQSATTVASTPALEQLKQLWKNTTEQERQQFIQYIIR